MNKYIIEEDLLKDVQYLASQAFEYSDAFYLNHSLKAILDAGPTDDDPSYITKWIDIKVKKPLLNQRILAYYTSPDSREGIHIRNCNDNEHTQLITHWMPLPDPPCEQEVLK